jgi:hypothetical protein
VDPAALEIDNRYVDADHSTAPSDNREMTGEVWSFPGCQTNALIKLSG